jgi:hypothetical protein
MGSDGMRKSQPEGAPLASDLAWWPDSQSLIFAAMTPAGENAGLWLVNADGADLRQLAVDAKALAGTYQVP